MPRAADTLGTAVERTLPLIEPQHRPDEPDTSLGYLDLLGPRRLESTGPAQDLMLSRAVPQIYERWWRPMLGRLAKGVFGPGMADERRIARLLLGLLPGDGVLDVACGTGAFTRDFARSVGPGGLAVGIDASETMLARAVSETRREGLAQVAYVRGDAQELPFRPESFDGVCCFAALNLFADPMRALDSMTAVLTRGGRIALFTSAGGRSLPLRAFQAAIQSQSGIRVFGRDELVEALEDRGFGEIRQRVTGFTQFVGGRLAS